MCLLVIPFSVIVSRIDSIEAGKINACLSTMGNFVADNEENTEKIKIINLIFKTPTTGTKLF